MMTIRRRINFDKSLGDSHKVDMERRFFSSLASEIKSLVQLNVDENSMYLNNAFIASSCLRRNARKRIFKDECVEE